MVDSFRTGASSRTQPPSAGASFLAWQPISGCHRLVAVGEPPTADGPGGKKNNKWLSSVSATTVAGRPSPRRPPINEQDSDMLELRLPRFWQRKTWSCRLPRNHRRRKYFAFTITEMMPLNFIAFCFCLFFFLPSQLTASYPGRRLLIRHFFTAVCHVLACQRRVKKSNND